jgi:FAD/FMN-containing dehydrogenase
MSTELIFETLAARWGEERITRDPDRLAPHLVEWRRRLEGHAAFLAEPASTAEVAEFVGLCAAHGASIVPQGGNTGLVGGQIPQGEALLSMRRMNRIRAIDTDADALTAEAGVILATVHDVAAAHDRSFPLSLAAQGSATIGGLVSTNAGGVHVVRYGMMRDLVQGLEVVLPDGRVLSALDPLRKNNTGYDLKQLFIGAEGTLGIVTAATLRLHPRPAYRAVAMAALASPRAAIDLLHHVRAAAGPLSAFEIMNDVSVALATVLPGVRAPFQSIPPWMALIELEDLTRDPRARLEAALAAAWEKGLIADAAVADSLDQQGAFWRLRESLPAGHRSQPGRQVSHDTSTPVSAVPEFLSRAIAAIEAIEPGAQIVAFGHAGDGNIHLTALGGPDLPLEAVSAAVHEIAVDLGGSISAEHGIGITRKADLARFKDPIAIEVMRAVRTALDPKGVMNPRVLF